MKLKKGILALTLLLFFSGCLSEEHELSATPDLTLSATTSQLADAKDCFDLKMQTWYSAFQYYQANGYDMQTADQKAVAEADAEYRACTSH